MDMGKIVGAIVSITVSVIVIASVLAPTILEYTETGGALEDYKGIVSAIVILSVVAVLMISVRLITNKD